MKEGSLFVMGSDLPNRAVSLAATTL